MTAPVNSIAGDLSHVNAVDAFYALDSQTINVIKNKTTTRFYIFQMPSYYDKKSQFKVGIAAKPYARMKSYATGTAVKHGLEMECDTTIRSYFVEQVILAALSHLVIRHRSDLKKYDGAFAGEEILLSLELNDNKFKKLLHDMAEFLLDVCDEHYDSQDFSMVSRDERMIAAEMLYHEFAHRIPTR